MCTIFFQIDSYIVHMITGVLNNINHNQIIIIIIIIMMMMIKFILFIFHSCTVITVAKPDMPCKGAGV